MVEIRWYKVWMVVPGTDGDAENGPCEPMWWNDMEQAPDEETAVRQANEKARREWEEPNWYEPGVKAPSAKEMGQECPVCTGAVAVTDEEYAAWKKELEEMDGFPEEAPFELSCKVKRIIAHSKPGSPGRKFEYGCQFVDTPPREQERLVQAVFTLQRKLIQSRRTT